MTWAAEDELLIRCCSIEMSDDAIHRARSVLKNPLDWVRVIETSILHGVAPLLYCGLNQVMQAGADDRAVPPAVLDELQGLYRASQARNRRVYRVVEEIFRAFKEADIEADRKSTRLNSSHITISYAVFCLKKKTHTW